MTRARFSINFITFSLHFQEAVRTRNSNGTESQALYCYPPEVENSPALPKSMEEKLEGGSLKVAVWSLSEVC